MSYWTGYSGSGLVLTEGEFQDMISLYNKKNSSQAESLSNTMEDLCIDEINLVKSVYAGTIDVDVCGLEKGRDMPEELCDKVIGVYALDPDYVEGATFWPFYRANGEMNIFATRKEGEEPLEYRLLPADNNCDSSYFFFADKDLTSPMAFEKKPYDSYDDFVQEFKDKLAAYLPDDFDWNSHLGNLSYACYA